MIELKKKLKIYRIIFWLSIFFVLPLGMTIMNYNITIGSLIGGLSIMLAIIFFILIKKLKQKINDVETISIAINDNKKE